ncbi:MAG: ABC transporter substrate-binding protein [Thermomicrobiales bacterium]
MDGDATASGSMRTQLNQAMRAHAANDRDGACDHIVQAIALDPDNELAWLWLAELSESPSERLYCLNHALRINPDSAGRQHRNRLQRRGIVPTTPKPIADLDDPVLPPTFRQVKAAPLRPMADRVRAALHVPARGMHTRAADGPPPGRRHRWAPWIAALLVLVTIVAALMILREQSRESVILIAVAGPMSGPESDIGTTMRNGATLAAVDFNRTTSGPHIRLVFFDDQGTPEGARTVAQQIVDNPQIVGVVGHGNSAASLAAAPIYQAAGIPAISAQSTSDELANYPDYFRTIFSNRTEGLMLGTYLVDVMKQPRVSIVTGTSTYEQELSDQFATAYAGKGGTVAHTWTIADTDTEASITQIVAALQADPNAGMIVLTLTEHHAYQLLLASRRAGIPADRMFGSETIGSDGFLRLFAGEPEEASQPGFFTEGLYAVSPLIYDAVGADTLAFRSTYERTYGETPGWRPAKIWDAVSAMATAADRADVRPHEADIARVRASITAQLHAISTPETSFRGLAGPMYFSANGDSPQGFSVGQFTDGILSSTPTQYRLVTNPTEYRMDQEVSSGRAFAIDGSYVRQYRVVYVGVEMIELRNLDLTKESFDADFFIAFRYNGNDDALQVTFPNATTQNLTLGSPLSTSTTNGGMHYVYYRVQGTFSAPMDFRDYPWDRHRLAIRFQNLHLTQNDIVYVVDPSSQAVPMNLRLTSAFDQSQQFDNIANWQVTQMLYAQASVTTSADDYDTAGYVQYSESRVFIDIKRNVNAYLLKNLLPLGLLSLVTYIALWFPADQANARVGFAISAVLSSSVMLGAIAGQLPDIGYTVAIEWGYYAYITLSAVIVMLTIAVGRNYTEKRLVRVRRIDILLRTIYPLAIGIVIFIYWWQFHASSLF